MAASNRIELQSCRCKNVTQKKKEKKKRWVPKLCSCPVASNWTYINPLEQVTFPFHFIHFILHDERKQKPTRHEVYSIGGALQKFIKQFLQLIRIRFVSRNNISSYLCAYIYICIALAKIIPRAPFRISIIILIMQTDSNCRLQQPAWSPVTRPARVRVASNYQNVQL